MSDENELRFIDSMALNGPIEEMLRESIKHDNLEFEWIYGDPFYPNKHPLTKEIFLKLKEKFTESTRYTFIEESNHLDIRCELRNKGRSVMSNIRATISGLSQIKQYCLHDTFDDLTPTFMKKIKYKNPKYPSTDYSSASSGLFPMRTTLKNEISLSYYSPTSDIGLQTKALSDKPELVSFLRNWSSKNKYFRYKKRYSFQTLDKLWRIDLTAVKSSLKKKGIGQYVYSKTFKDSNILNQPEKFELEIEYIGNHSTGFTPPPIVEFSEDIHMNVFQTFPDEGNFYIPDEDLSLAIDIPSDVPQDMYEDYGPPSPSYYPDGDIEYDTPRKIDSPRPSSPNAILPDTITVKDDYWKEMGHENIESIYKKGYEPEPWIHQTYKLLPRENYPSTKQLKVDIVPPISYMNKDNTSVTVSELLIPYQYIHQKIDEPLPVAQDEGFSPESPRFSPESPMKGGGYSVPSKCYTEKVIDKLFEKLEEIIHFSYSCIVGSEYYLDSLQGGNVISAYNDLADPMNVINSDGWKFIGPQPVSMGLPHLHHLNSHSIVSKYVVTEKADGVRAQLLINNNPRKNYIQMGRGYIITPKKLIIDTGVNFDCKESYLFDGEYITQDKQGEPIQLFMIFDVYYSTEYSTQPYTYPWLSKKGESRSAIIHKFKSTVEMKSDDLYPGNSVRIGFKQYLEGPTKLTKKKGTDNYSNIKGIFKSTKKLLDMNDSFEYNTDGLIFLPMYLPVKGSEEGDIVKSIKGTWNYNYKWKPPEENTIDFKIIFSKEKHKPIIHSYKYVSPEGRSELRYYQKVQLVVGYSEKDDTMIDFNWSILTDTPLNKQSYQYFDPPTHKKDNIHITNIPLDKKKMICVKDKRIIQNGDIIEMKYNPESDNGFSWTPLRIRDDKENPQYFTIANNIWQTINEPITESMIRGTIDFDEIEESIQSKTNANMYYVDTKYAEDKPIRSLHNYIKSKLISRVGSSSDIKGDLLIADLSCGRGGDIKKYLSVRNKVEFILGLDISGNINEAAQRYHYIPKPKPKSLFLQFDTSQPVEKKQGILGDKELSETMLDIIFGKSKAYPNKYKQIQKEYSGIAQGGFQLVSSQFSLHYYFKDEETLRGFCENVRYLCADGGYFIGTCYDGMKLMKTFAHNDTDTLEMKDEFGSLIYQIKQKFSITDFSYDKDNLKTMFGNEIDVFMASIGQTITEYLVNFEFFIDIMKEYGFELALPSFKKGEYNPIKEPIQSFDHIIQNMDEIREKDFNFVKKTYNRDMFDVRGNKQYTLLSGLNNYFIFQKQ